MRRTTTRRVSLALTLVAVALTTLPGVASASEQSQSLNGVRQATVPYHNVANAESAGYSMFLDCFDSDAGGMGQHYVNLNALDGEVDALSPEAMVYEVTGRGLKLVAVEYIVPGDLVDPANPPQLFGMPFHENTALGVWVLHAWIWKKNPSGIFADYNPNVRQCPVA